MIANGTYVSMSMYVREMSCPWNHMDASHAGRPNHADGICDHNRIKISIENFLL